MEQPDFNKWNEERYVELNSFFRMRIQDLVDYDPTIKELMLQKNGLQLSDLVDRMSEQEQGMWLEFIELDQLKLQIDMHNHLHGKGTPYTPGSGFSNNQTEDEDEGPELW